MAETRTTENSEHILTLWNGRYRTGQIAVSPAVFRHQPTHERNKRIGIELIKLAKRESFGSGQLDHTQCAAGTQHPVHLPKTIFEMFKITHPVGDRHHIETVVVECHRQAILHLEKNPLLCISLGHFLTSYAQHAFRQIDTHDTVWMQTLVQ